MIVSRVLGGLGNQMFQFAAASALAARLGTDVALDTSGFAHYGLHNGFELSRIFAGPFHELTGWERMRVLGWRGLPVIRRGIPRFGRMAALRGPIVMEPHFHYWDGIFRCGRGAYLCGYWQSEKYFADHSDRIRAAFRFGNSGELADGCGGEIGHSAAVSVHIRRGDYVSNPAAAAVYAACTPDYYTAAVRYIAERESRIRLLVFSDDISWVRQNLDFSAWPHTYMDGNSGSDSWRDMQLMSLCRHHVIANSSFSWWGAWLNERSDKIVVAPKAWFLNQVDTSDLIPSVWVRL